jgi:hypothetical protein
VRPLLLLDIDGVLNPWAAESRAVARFAYGRPLAWLDDDFDLRVAAKASFLARRDMPTLLVPVHPAVGVTDGDLARVEHWLRSSWCS